MSGRPVHADRSSKRHAVIVGGREGAAGAAWNTICVEAAVVRRIALLAVVLLTEWGVFTCSGIRCEKTPRPGLEAYWSAGTLLVAREHVPLGRRACQLLPDRTDTWRCGGAAAGPGTLSPAVHTRDPSRRAR